MRAPGLVVVLAACGGGGDDGHLHITPDASIPADVARAIDAAPDVPRDAAPTPDAPHTCGVDIALGQLSFGTSTARVIRNNFDAGQFFVAARLGPVQPDGTLDALVLDVYPPADGYTTGTPYANEPDATTMGPITADAYILGDYNPNTDALANLYWAIDGATTFTQFGGTTTGSLIDGSLSTTNFHEIDQNTGEPLVGGCTTTLNGLAFYVQQN